MIGYKHNKNIHKHFKKEAVILNMINTIYLLWIIKINFFEYLFLNFFHHNDVYYNTPYTCFKCFIHFRILIIFINKI